MAIVPHYKRRIATMENAIQGRFEKWWKELRQEFRKVVWPTWSKLRQNTMIVIVYIALIGVVIAGLDTLFAWAMGTFVNPPL